VEKPPFREHRAFFQLSSTTDPQALPGDFTREFSPFDQQSSACLGIFRTFHNSYYDYGYTFRVIKNEEEGAPRRE
jgi:hypothetical protein